MEFQALGRDVKEGDGRKILRRLEWAQVHEVEMSIVVIRQEGVGDISHGRPL